MPSTDPGALSATISQTSTTSGLDDYVLGKPVLDKLRFSAAYDDGDTIRYHVTDTSGQVEITRGIYTLATETLSRDLLILSSTGSFINWPTTGQRIVTPIVPGLPLCDTEPTDGQALIWDATTGKWCPGDIVDTTDDDTWDMQDVTTGTSV